MDPRPHILVLLTRIPYPLTDGTRFKVFDNILKGLSQQYVVDVAIVTAEQLTPQSDQALRSVVRQVFHIRLSLLERVGNLLRGIGSWRPFQTWYFRSGRAARLLAEKMKEYDAVYVHTLRAAPYVRDVPATKVIIDFNDALSLNYQEARKKALFPWNIIYAIEESRVRAYEKALLARYTFFTVVSSYDRDYLLQMADDRERVFSVTPHGIDDRLIGRKQRQRATMTKLCFLGRLEYPPNTDAVRHFLTTIWPLVHARHPEWTFTVYGKGAHLFTPLPGVTFAGFVPDQGAALSQEDVFVAPIRFGAGTPTKILEAMAVGLPVVGTALSMRGLLSMGERDFGAVVQEDTPLRWCAALESLLDPSAREQCAVYNRAYVAEHYTNHSARRGYQALVAKLLTRAGE